MARLFTFLMLALLSNSAEAQLLTIPHGLEKPGDIVTVAEVPENLAKGVKLKFIERGTMFDGGSNYLHFTLPNDHEFMLYFPHPGYWTATAKLNSIQPVAIYHKKGPPSFSEIKRGSLLESRLCKLMAETIASGGYTRDEVLTMIEFRDSLLTRTPLSVWSNRFDQKTWDPKP